MDDAGLLPRAHSSDELQLQSDARFQSVLRAYRMDPRNADIMAAYNPTVDERVLFSAERGLRIRVPSAKRGDQQLKSAAFVVTNIALYAVSTAPGTKYKWLCRIAWLDLQAVLLSHGKSEEAGKFLLACAPSPSSQPLTRPAQRLPLQSSCHTRMPATHVH